MQRRQLLKLGAAAGVVASVISRPVLSAVPVVSRPQYETIPADQLRGASFYVNNDSRGSYFTGVHVLLLRHVAALGLAGNLTQLRDDVESITECLARADHYVEEDGGLDEVLSRARESLPEDALWGLADLGEISQSELRAGLVARGSDTSLLDD